MDTVRKTIGGLGNLMFKEAYLISKYLDGDISDVYLQSSKYWEKHSEQIKGRFSNGIGFKDVTAIHFRRGDYLDSDFHANLCRTDYYEKAIKLFPSTEQFLVFCKDNQNTKQDVDDREWVTRYMDTHAHERWSFATSILTETQDLNLMASCKNVIMANSSFSWWAAFLGKHKMVVCPKTWFADGVQRTELLDEWIQV